LFCLTTSQIFGQKIVLNSTFTNHEITTKTTIFEDKSNAISFSEIPKQAFSENKKKTYIFPFSNSTYWVKFTLENRNKNTKDWVLVWDNAMAENIYFHVPQADGSYKIVKDGALVHKPKNRFTENTPTLKFSLPDNKLYTFYVKIQSQRAHMETVRLYSATEYIEYNLGQFKSEGFLNGLFTLRLIYIVLLAFFVIKDKTFQRYSAVIIVRTLAYWGLLGILGAVFTSNPKVAMLINQLVYYILPIGFVSVIYALLEVNRFPKFVQITLKLIPFFTIFFCLAVLFNYNWYWHKGAVFMIAFTVILITIMHLVSIFKKYKVQWAYSIPFLLGILSNLYIPTRLLGFWDFPGSGPFSLLCFIAEIGIFGLFLGKIIRNYEKNKIKAETELQYNIEKTEKLKELDALKTNFFANITHEFRTPLTLIIGPIEKLMRENPTTEIYNLINRNAKRLLDLVNQILDISKLEGGEMKPEIQKIEMVSLFKTIAASFNSLAESKNITYSVNQNTEKAFGYIDKDKVEKIIQNLLSNAFKFTKEGQKVEVLVNYSENNESISIIIKDTGLGIQSEKLNQIFNRFYQIEDTKNKNIEGTGIGLALVKELVTVLKGTISVESEYGIGTTFKVILPTDSKTWHNELIKIDINNAQIQQPNESQITVNEPIEAIFAHENESQKLENILLIVEDNDDIRLYIKSIFENTYRTIEAINGKEGLKIAYENIPDIIISDLMMPEMDGFEFCKTIKSDERTSHIPVIMLTAKADVSSRIEGFELGADDYLTKPFNSTEIISRVKNLVLTRESLKKHYYSQTANSNQIDIKIQSADEKFLARANEIIEQNIADTQFNVDLFASSMNLSSVQLRRKIKALTNLTVVEFIRIYRLNKAAILLKNKAGNISEIAYMVGFDSLTYFGRMFQEVYSMSPTEYRNLN
jgi:signal transduction histidine kinase/DNA-binding response OmpR family regulator